MSSSHIPQWDGGNPFSRKFVGLINALIDSVNRFLGVAEDIDGVLKITSEKFPDLGGDGGNPVIPAFVTASTGGPPIWTYEWAGVENVGGVWSLLSGGRTGTIAKNAAEINNTPSPNATINYGQVLTDDATVTYTILPIANNSPIEVEVYKDKNGVDQEWFTASPNPIEVACRDIRKPQPIPPGEAPQPPP